MRPGPDSNQGHKACSARKKPCPSRATDLVFNLAADQVLVRENDIAKQVAQEIAVTSRCWLVAESRLNQTKFAGYAGSGGYFGCSFLECAGEVKAAHQRMRVIGLVFKNNFDKACYGISYRIEFNGKREKRRSIQIAAITGQLFGAHGGQAAIQVFKLLCNHTRGIVGGVQV